VRDIIVLVKFYSPGTCDNPVEPCRIPDNYHYRFSRLNSDPLPFRGFSSLSKLDPLVVCREIELGLIYCYNIMPSPVFLVLEDLEGFK
jgi:hypothetical protein